MSSLGEPESKKFKLELPSSSEVEIQNVKHKFLSEIHDKELPHNLKASPVLTIESNLQEEEIHIKTEEIDDRLDNCSYSKDKLINTSQRELLPQLHSEGCTSSQNGCVSSSGQEGPGSLKKIKLTTSGALVRFGTKADKYNNESITETEIDAMILESNLKKNVLKIVTNCLLFSNVSDSIENMRNFIIDKYNETPEAKGKNIVIKNVLLLPISFESNRFLIRFTPKEATDLLYNIFNGLNVQGKIIHVRRDTTGDLTTIYHAMKRNRSLIMARTQIPYPTSVFQQLSNFTNIDAKYHYREKGPHADLTKMYGLKPECVKALNLPSQAINTNIIFVENLNPEMEKSDIREVFSMAGLVMNVTIHRGPAPDRLVAFITYDHPLEAIQAVLMFHRHEIYYRRVKVIMFARSNRIILNGCYTHGPGLGPDGHILKGARTFCELNIMRQEINDIKNSIKNNESQKTCPNFGVNATVVIPGESNENEKLRRDFYNFRKSISNNISKTKTQTPRTDEEAIKDSNHIFKLQKLRKEFDDFRKSFSNDKGKNSFQQNNVDKDSFIAYNYMTEIETLRQEFDAFKNSVSLEIENQVKQARLEIASSLNSFCQDRIDALLKYKGNVNEHLNRAKLEADTSNNPLQEIITKSNNNDIEKVSNVSKDNTNEVIETNNRVLKCQSSANETNEFILQISSNQTNKDVATERNSPKSAKDAVKTLQDLMSQGNSVEELSKILDSLKNAGQESKNKNEGKKVTFETNEETNLSQSPHEKYSKFKQIEVIESLGCQIRPGTRILRNSDNRQSIFKKIQYFKADTEQDNIISIPSFQNNVMPSVSSISPQPVPSQSILTQWVQTQSAPSQSMMPQVMQPQVMQPQLMQPQLMQPQSMPPQSVPPQSMSLQMIHPQSMQPQPITPHLMPPHSMQPQSMSSQSIQGQSMPPQLRPSQPMLPHSIQGQLMPPQSIQMQSMLPQLMPPQLTQPRLMPPQSMQPPLLTPQSVTPHFMVPQSNRLHQNSAHSILSNATQSVAPQISHGSPYIPIPLSTPQNERVTLVFKNLPPSVTYTILFNKLSADYPNVRIIKFGSDGAQVQLENNIDAERCIHKYHRSLVDKTPIDVGYT